MKNSQDGPYAENVACIGICWRIRRSSGGIYLSHVVSLNEADEYGDFLTHPSGHYEIWESWKTAGIAKIRSMGLPSEIVSTEYEEHPRGRVVFNRTTDQFTIYADQRLQSKGAILEIVKMFGIEEREYVVQSDSHYVKTPFV